MYGIPDASHHASDCVLPDCAAKRTDLPTFKGMGRDEGAFQHAFFHHSRTSTRPSALADSRARSEYRSGKPDDTHQSKTFMCPDREAPSMASALCSWVDESGESRHHVRIVGLP